MLNDIFYELQYIFEDIFYELEYVFDDFFYYFEDFMATGIGLVFIFGLLAFAAIAGIAMFILSAYPVYKLAKKLDRPNAKLAWIPLLYGSFHLWIICDTNADKPVEFKGKELFKDRKTSFLVCLAVQYLGALAVGVISGILSLIPFVGMFTFILAYIPAVIVQAMSYIYLRDMLDLFSEDKKANDTAALIVSVLDCFVTMGLARTVYLWTLLKKEPLPPAEPNEYFAETPPVYSSPANEAPIYTAPVNETPDAQPQEQQDDSINE